MKAVYRQAVIPVSERSVYYPDPDLRDYPARMICAAIEKLEFDGTELVFDLRLKHRLGEAMLIDTARIALIDPNGLQYLPAVITDLELKAVKSVDLADEPHMYLGFRGVPAIIGGWYTLTIGDQKPIPVFVFRLSFAPQYDPASYLDKCLPGAPPPSPPKNMRIIP